MAKYSQIVYQIQQKSNRFYKVFATNFAYLSADILQKLFSINLAVWDTANILLAGIVALQFYFILFIF